MTLLASSSAALKSRFVSKPGSAAAGRSEDELLEAAALHLALLAVPGIGTVAAVKLLEARGGIGNVAAADDEIGAAVRRHAGAARAAVGRAVTLSIGVVPFEHPAYPPALLQNVAGPPPVLFVEGALPPTFDVPASELRSCAVVGTRRASRYSLDLATALGRALVSHEIVVVSGLAMGVDAAAHQGALAGAGTKLASAGTTAPGPATIAVLGGGHSHLHPAVHANLARRIVAQGGAVLSEWPPDTPPARHHFLRRNRIISALARCVVIVEAGRRSGALNTASHAMAQTRHLLVVPGRPDDPRYAGNLGLLRDGADLLVDISQVLLAFGIVDEDPANRVTSTGARVAIPWSSPLPSIELGPLAESVRQLLSVATDVSLDGLLAGLGDGVNFIPTITSTAAELTALLTAMELAGEVEQTPSGRYRLQRLSAVGA